MENTKMYVVAEVGYEALFEAMVAQAEADIASAKTKMEIAWQMANTQDDRQIKKAEAIAEKAEKLQADAKKGLADWLKVLKVLDIADAVIR